MTRSHTTDDTQLPRGSERPPPGAAARLRPAPYRGGDVLGLALDAEVRVADARGGAPLRQYVLRRLRSALRPFQQQVRRITVRVVDENGPRAGVDTRCSIVLELRNGRRVVVSAISAWPHVAVSLAARRLTRMAGRENRRDTITPVPMPGLASMKGELHQ